MTYVALRRAQRGVNRQAVLGADVRENSVAVAYRLTAIDDAGQLPARRC